MKYYFLILILALASCKTNTVIADKNTSIKDSLSFELSQIYGSDQGIRLSSGFKDKMKMIQSIDTFNFNRIVAFTRQNGFPNENLLGKSNYKRESVKMAAFSVLLHNPHRLVNEQEYFDLFLGEVKKGLLKKENFADILDKYYWTKSKNKENRRVFYGSQFGKPCIQTKETTNLARIEIGLKPLADSEFVDCAGEELDMPKKKELKQLRLNNQHRRNIL
ncbi:hypothetical protein [Flavobacterium sp. 102]|uniref:hypothetical protein n=1 Tax=Flavobacterium sp. 102 TaxID=2135623 RepID=UPI0011C3B893|nr:hypothetical protein [Flavobacterium sp. 102]